MKVEGPAVRAFLPRIDELVTEISVVPDPVEGLRCLGRTSERRR